MADIIKYIASFSEDAVHNAIEQAVGAEKEYFTDMLTKIQFRLEKPPRQQKKESKMYRQSDKAVFEQKILPQIREKVTEYNRLETSSKELEWKVHLKFVGDYKSLNMNELKQRHALILEEEKSLASIDLVAKYYRGLVYFRARELIDKDQNIKAVFRAEFGVCYNTICRYIKFAALLKCYPRLMICELTYAQITKHQKRLLDYLDTDAKLHDELSQPLCASAQSKAIEIHPADIKVPKISFSTDDDYCYDPAWNDIPEDEETARWLQELHDSGEMLKTNYDSESEMEIQQELQYLNIAD